MKTIIQIPREVAEAFDSKDYNNQRNFLLEAAKMEYAGSPCPYGNTELCEVCNYVRGMGKEKINSAIRKLTQNGIGRRTKLAEILN